MVIGGGSPEGRNGRKRTAFIAVSACAAALCLSPAPTAASSGKVFQFSGANGCTKIDGAEGCATGRALLGASSVAISPDGANVYVASNESGSLTMFFRNRGGRLTQAHGLNGCVNVSGDEKCQTGRGMEGPFSIAVSPDGANVYVATLGGVAVFARKERDGALRQLSGMRGCINQDGDEGCATGRGIDVASSVVVSPDGQNVYVAGLGSRAIAVFDRDSETGALTQPAGAVGCISAAGSEGCASGRSLSGPFSLAISPEGDRLFVTAHLADAVVSLYRDVMTGALTQLPGASCLNLTASEGCGLARALERPNGIALSPGGDSLYVASSGDSSLVSIRVRGDGTLVQHPGKRGCMTPSGVGNCRPVPSLGGAFAVTVSSDERNVYAVSDQAVAGFQRETETEKPGRTGSLKPINCVSHHGVDDCSTGRALDGASSLALDPTGHHLYVSAYDSGAVSTFARDPVRGRVRVRLKGLPKTRCAKRSFRVRVRVKSRLPLRRTRVFLNGKRVGTSTKQRFRLFVRPHKLKRGRHQLKIKAADVAGTKIRRKARFRSC